MSSSTPKRQDPALFVLRTQEDLRCDYEHALSGYGSIEWFDSVESLVVAAERRQPVAAIIDLDAVDESLPVLAELLRGAMPRADLLALSSTDSSQIAMQCLRFGFSDFLLKPASPEELAWSLHRASQRTALLDRWDDPHDRMVQAITEIATCTSAALVRLTTLKYLQELLNSRGCAWVQLAPTARVLGSIPSRLSAAQVLARIPEASARNSRGVYRNKRSERKVILRCRTSQHGKLVLWGVPTAVARRTLDEATALLDHAELSLHNLAKLEALQRQTFIDDLTGLFNARYLKFALTSAVAKCRKPGSGFSVLFIDVDKFKMVNDTHGHSVGSEFLVALGKTVRNAVRSQDPVFRYGGDEFVVILQGASIDKAHEIAERLRRQIEKRVFHVQDKVLRTTVSIGIANYPQHAKGHETLLKLADQAMYSAKKQSRNAVHLALGLPSEPSPTRIEPEL